MDIKCMGPDCTTELLPETEEEAFAQGWRQADNYEVSPKLKLVWICSDCVDRLISLLTMKMRTAEQNTQEAYEGRLHDLMEDHRLRMANLRRWYAQGMDTIHRSYGDALGQLKSPEARAADAALAREKSNL